MPLNAGRLIRFNNRAALTLDGSNDHLTFTPPTHSSKITVAVWYERTADGDTFPRIITLPTFRLYLESSGGADYVGVWQDCDGTDGDWQSTATVNRTDWHHFAATYDFSNTNNNPIIYVDGSPVTIVENQTPTSTTCTNVGTGYIGGQDATNNNPAARIDDLHIYDEVLTPSRSSRWPLAAMPRGRAPPPSPSART